MNTEPRKLVIAIDLDAIIIDLVRPWLGWYNRLFNDNITIDDVTSYKIEQFTKKTDDMFAFFADQLTTQVVQFYQGQQRAY